MKKFLAALALCAPILLASTASIAAPDPAVDDCAIAKQQGHVCRMVFDGEDVDGQPATGDGDQITGISGADFGDLFHPRVDFRQLIISSLELVK